MHADSFTATTGLAAARRHVPHGLTAVLVMLGLALGGGAARGAAVDSPLSPEQARESFAVHPDLRIELVAAEPQVVDPVAMAFDEHGRLWVVEMRDYPFGPQDGEPGESRIKLLEDLDGDGYFETVHLFADGLLFATGVLPWRGGVIVTLSGQIAWLADTDGDHRADVHETWFRGFAEKNPQLRANDPTLWYDGQVYIAGGLFYGGQIATVHEPWRAAGGREPIDLGSRDFRFNPRTGRAERIAGGAQFGLAFDLYGNRFVCSNSRPLEHVVFEEHYLNRNPHAGMTKTNELVVPGGEARPLYPLSRQETTSYLHEGQFTAACGALIYGGNGLPAAFRGNAFVCEPTASLVHREVLRPQGASFAAEAGREGVEFLASRDSWFRPVFLSEGPDGALYVVDMYRAVIEHPDWFPDLANRDDLRDGDDRGRIWRIVGTRAEAGTAPRDTRQSLGILRSQVEPGKDLVGKELAALLDHPNAWHRLTATRRLYEGSEEMDLETVRGVLRDGSTAAGRSAALHVLAGLGELTTDDLLTALASDDALARQAALRLVEQQADKDASIRRRIAEIARAARADSRTVFQTLLALGGKGDEKLTQIIHAAATSEAAGDPWLRAAILSAAHDVQASDLAHICTAYAENPGEPGDGRLLLVRQLSEQIVADAAGDDEIRAALPVHSDHRDLTHARLLGMARGLRHRGIPFRDWITNQPETWQAWWRQRLADAVAVVADEKLAPAVRRQALAILELGSYDSVAADLARLLAESGGVELRPDVIRSIGSFDRAEAAELLLAGIETRTPAERRTAFEVLLSGRAGTEQLVAKLEAGILDAALLDAGSRQRLLSDPRDDVRQRAERIFADSAADVENLLVAYRSAVDAAGDAARGREVFTRHCAACHRVGGVGTAVGPDVADNYNRTREQLLVAIFDPNRAIDSSYESYVVITRSGRTLQGLLAGETAAAVTLQDADSQTNTIPRDEIEELRPTGRSFMPSGLEKDIDADAMADLLTFLKDWRNLR